MTYFDNKGHTSGVCGQCGNEYERVYAHWSKSSSCENPDQIPYSKFALFSGGHDSLVSTHYAMENDLAECVVHLDTNTGIDENVQFVKDVCEEFDWHLEIYTARMELEEFAKEYGFPKAPSHSWAYRYFKERPLRRVARDSYKNNQEMYTGVRKSESERRMRTIEEEEEQYSWIWYSPISDWTKEDCEEYIDEHNLPKNNVVDNICRSGECYCGAYAHRDEELIDLAAEYPEHAEWILKTEKSVQEEIGQDEDHCWWGGGGVSSDRIQELQENDDREDTVPMMCKDCGVSFENIE